MFVSEIQHFNKNVCVSFVDLRKCEEQGELLLPLLFLLLVVLSVLMYFAVSLMDPGFVVSDTAKVPKCFPTFVSVSESLLAN